MIFGSVCSGIEAVSVAWCRLPIKPAWFSEIEPFPCAVLAHHYPEVPNLGDMTTIKAKVLSGDVVAPDVLVGGTPCQAFSLAGLRGSLDDTRGQLTLEFVRLADAIDDKRNEPAVILWENVPGVLNTKDNAFGCFLAGLAGEDEELQPAGGKWSNAGCVFGSKRAVAWRILDAQYFGVAQRRRRVFVVASARNGFDPAKVLFEFDGLRRDSAPCREAGKDVAGTLASRTGAGGFPGTDEACSGYIQPVGYRMVAFGEYACDGTASAMKARDYKDATDLAVSVVHGTQDPCSTPNGVRRLTPVECERLQGFPDGYTLIPDWYECCGRVFNSEVGKYGCANCNGENRAKLKVAADSQRYKALGNSMAVPVMRWIGKRIYKHLSGLL
jgi:DNA (cytosine-5)-methyltransferase 1